MSEHLPKFSIIATHYDKTVSNEVLQRFIDSLNEQTFKDFEVIIMHDGPVTNSIKDIKFHRLDLEFVSTDRRYNDWGHSLRTLGMQRAKGEFFLNTNTDNVYLSDALEILNNNLDNTHMMYSMNVVMMGLNRDLTKVWYDNPRDYSKKTLFYGDNISLGNIDLMQIAIHHSVWKLINYWYDKSECSDAIIYNKLAQVYPVKYINKFIGFHY